ncbi:hypothetical protein PGB90_004323 [Kerria lacca]
MAAKVKVKHSKKSNWYKNELNIKNFLQIIYQFLFSYEHFKFTAIILFLFELILNIVIINWVSYTEIDWKAYMQEVEGVINGTFDYSKLKGDTGPLVYPAGFVYIFSIFYFITNSGENIKIAQYIYVLIYLISLYLLYRIYSVCKKVPPYVLILCCCTAYRIHSIYILRMFNDPIAILLFYFALNLFLGNNWIIGSIVYSLAVSVKMNILLYAPALLIAYVTQLGITGTVKHITICAFVQFALSIPFLISNPKAYIKQSFDFGRIFLFKWTVNWRFIPEDVFLHPIFHVLLLSIHLLLLLYFSVPMYKSFKSYVALKQLEKEVQPQLKNHNEMVDMGSINQLFLTPFFVSNFIGIVCSRSLHYQFYVWYYHTLPFLLWSTAFSNQMRLLILGIIELCWNIYPSTKLSSVSLFLCHTAILWNLIKKFKPKEKN